MGLRTEEVKMSLNVDLSAAVNNLLNIPETVEKFMYPSRAHDNQENRGASSIPVDILDTPKEYVFFMDVPGLSKSEIQVLTNCLITI